MIERTMPLAKLTLRTPLIGREIPRDNDTEVSRTLRDGGVNLNDIAQIAAQPA